MYTPKPPAEPVTALVPVTTDRPALPLKPPRPASAPKRDARGRLLPGANLNPHGQPKGLKRLMDEVVGEEGYKKCFETLASIAYGELSKATPMHVRVRAIDLIFDRRWGKPHVSVEIKGEDGAPAGNLGTLTPDQLRERRAALAALLAEGAPAPEEGGE